MNIKKIFMLGIGVLCLTGCGSKKDEFLGTWSTKYSMPPYDEVTQIYEFNKDKTCKKILVTDTKIEKNCTYEKKEDTVVITEDGKEAKEYHYRFEDKNMVLGGNTYTKSK